MEAKEERGDFFIFKTEGEDDSIKWVSHPKGRYSRLKYPERTLYKIAHDPFNDEKEEI